MAEADRPAFHASLIQVRQGGEKHNWEFRLHVGEEEPLPVSVNVRAQTDHRDQLVRVLWLLREASEETVKRKKSA